MRLIIYILLLLVGWQPLVWAGASSVETNLSVEKETSISTEKKSRKVLRLQKKYKKPRFQKKQETFEVAIWIFSILSVLGMVGLGLGLGLGISWLLWFGFGTLLFYLIFSLIKLRVSRRDDWDAAFIFAAAIITTVVFGLVAIVLGIVFSVVWVWVVGLALFVLSCSFLALIFSAFSGFKAPRY